MEGIPQAETTTTFLTKVKKQKTRPNSEEIWTGEEWTSERIESFKRFFAATGLEDLCLSCLEDEVSAKPAVSHERSSG